MKIKFFFTLSLCMYMLSACETTQTSANKDSMDEAQTMLAPDKSNSRSALDWDGVYRGMLPCADCEGILMEIQLDQDGSYDMGIRYMGKGSGSIRQAGKFEWDTDGGILTLLGTTEDVANQYRVGENVLIKLDLEGQAIQGELASFYRLPKITSPNDIREVYWKLIELKGQAIAADAESSQEAHILLKMEDQRIYGYGGCNRFFGSYEWGEGGQISFSQMGSSLRACANLDVETSLLSIFEEVDNYTQEAQVLSLNKAGMVPLARFEAVHLR